MRRVLLPILIPGLLAIACQDSSTSPSGVYLSGGGEQSLAGTEGVKVTGGGHWYAVGQDRPWSCASNYDHYSATDLGNGRARGEVEHRRTLGEGNWPNCVDTGVVVRNWHMKIDRVIVKPIGDLNYVNICGVISYDKLDGGFQGARWGIAIEDNPAGDRMIKRPWIDCADPENPYMGPAFWYAMYKGDVKVHWK